MNPYIFELAFINAVSQGSQGNAMDAAIIKHNETSGEEIPIPYYQNLAVTSFTFERRRSSCIIRGYAQHQMLICKGAFDEILNL